MLKKLIIHLKNVIFFKLIIYFATLFVVIKLLQFVNYDYNESIKKKHNTEGLVAEEILRVYSLKYFEKNILASYNQYYKLLSTSYKQNCLKRIELIRAITELSRTYDLNEPITTSIKQEFLSKIKSYGEENRSNIKIRNYNVVIKFATKDLATTAEVIKKIYSLMPKNTMLLSLSVEEEDVMEPKTIYKLSTQKKPDMVFTKLNMRIREIAT